jgi:hypothetical protein
VLCVVLHLLYARTKETVTRNTKKTFFLFIFLFYLSFSHSPTFLSLCLSLSLSFRSMHVRHQAGLTEKLKLDMQSSSSDAMILVPQPPYPRLVNKVVSYFDSNHSFMRSSGNVVYDVISPRKFVEISIIPPTSINILDFIASGFVLVFDLIDLFWMM